MWPNTVDTKTGGKDTKMSGYSKSQYQKYFSIFQMKPGGNSDDPGRVLGISVEVKCPCERFLPFALK